MPLPALKIAILHYQPKGDEVDPVVTQLSEALASLGHQVTLGPLDVPENLAHPVIHGDRGDGVAEPRERLGELRHHRIHLIALRLVVEDGDLQRGERHSSAQTTPPGAIRLLGVEESARVELVHRERGDQ